MLLRPWHDDDIESWVAMSADPRVMEFFPSLVDRARAEATAKRGDRLERHVLYRITREAFTR